MRILPLALIAIGVFWLLRHYGFVDPALLQLFWPLLLIGIGIAMLARGPRWRADMRERMHDKWERRMHRHFGPGWANLSDEERDRFRAGMREWRSRGHRGGSDGAIPPPSGRPPAPAEPR